jgi:hypothetical protein
MQSSSTALVNDAHRVVGTWEIVKLPHGKKAIGSRWFMKIKCYADGTLDCYKARLITKGYSQYTGFDFHETNVCSDSLIFCCESCTSHWRIWSFIHSMDISHAYLNGELEEEICMQQPEGFEVGGPDHVCKLHKSLYGLK